MSNKEYYQIPTYYEDQTLWFDYLILDETTFSNVLYLSDSR